MTWAHLHLALNHFPVVGIPLGVFLLGFALYRRSRDLTLASFWLLAGLALVTLFVYLTGEPAEELVEGLAGVSEPLMERHEAAALAATVATAILGIAAAVGLVRSRGGRSDPRRYATAVLLLALLASGVLAWTANLGGQIRHSEIRSASGELIGNEESSAHPQPTGEDQD
jgi:hypothetical protein